MVYGCENARSDERCISLHCEPFYKRTTEMVRIYKNLHDRKRRQTNSKWKLQLIWSKLSLYIRTLPPQHCRVLMKMNTRFDCKVSRLSEVLDLLLEGATTASEELTDSKPHQTENTTQTAKRKWTLFIWLTVDHSLGSKDAKSSILWTIYRDQLNQSQVSRNKYCRKCMRSNSVSRVCHAASNTEDGLPVVTLPNTR